MAYRVPRRSRSTHLQRRGGFIALLAFATAAAACAPIHAPSAQIIIGGTKRPAVSVDTAVLDRLGPAPTLPQMFLGARTAPSGRQVAIAKPPTRPHVTKPARHVRSRHVAVRAPRPTARKVALAQKSAQPKSSLNEIIHLVPPAPRMASAAPAPNAPVLHEQAAITAPAKASVVALRAPASLPPTPPKQPSDSDGPVSAIAATTPAREVSAPTPLSPPSQAATMPPPAVALPALALPVAAVTTTSAAAPPAMPVAVASASSPAPAAAVVSAPVAAPAPQLQVAAATTAASMINSLKFAAGATDLPPGGQQVLDAAVNRLLTNDNLRVQVVAHATGGADDAMEARRVSLARAVTVRAYLIEKGVRSLRIDVRALGNRADSGPAADQVDLMIVSQ